MPLDKLFAVFPVVVLAACSQINLGPAELPDDRDSGSPEVYAPKPEYEASHRYDKKQELLFDQQLGVYLAVGHPGVYFYRDVYYRQSADGWHQANKATGPWALANKAALPSELQNIRPDSRKR